MIDIFRLVLSLIVVQAHLLSPNWPWLGWQAVFSFYTMSGFLMTLVLQEVYGFSVGGFGRFWANRFLRLYPPYWIVVAAVVALGLAGVHTAGLQPVQRMPETLDGWISNIAIFGLSRFTVDNVSPRMVVTAWSLSVEVVSYVLLSLYFAKTPRRLLVMAGIGLLVTIATVIVDLPNYNIDADFFARYTTAQAGFLPFAIGGLAYHARNARIFTPTLGKWVVISALLLIQFVAAAFSPLYAHTIALYGASVLSAFLIVMLFRIDGETRKAAWKRLCGGLAYPLFITHWLVGTLVALYVPILPVFSVQYFLVCLTVALALSTASYFGVELQLEKLRRRLRPRRPVVTQAAAAPASRQIGPEPAIVQPTP